MSDPEHPGEPAPELNTGAEGPKKNTPEVGADEAGVERSRKTAPEPSEPVPGAGEAGVERSRKTAPEPSEPAPGAGEAEVESSRETALEPSEPGAGEAGVERSRETALEPQIQDIPDRPDDDVELTLGEHLEELRARIITSLYAIFGVLAICLLDQEFYMEIILSPHTRAMEALNFSPTIQVLQYEESFFSHLKVSFIAALILSMPFIIYQAWLFVSVGLFPHEKKYFKLFFPFALLFFGLGVLFGYFVLIPVALKFLGGYGGSHIRVGFTLSSYISLFFVLTFVAGLVFELPLLMLFLNKVNIFSTYDYMSKWRHFILSAFIIAAFFTPPDAVTQVLMAGPMVFLYFFGLLLCRLTERLHIIRQFLQMEYPDSRDTP